MSRDNICVKKKLNFFFENAVKIDLYILPIKDLHKYYFSVKKHLKK